MSIEAGYVSLSKTNTIAIRSLRQFSIKTEFARFNPNYTVKLVKAIKLLIAVWNPPLANECEKIINCFYERHRNLLS